MNNASKLVPNHASDPQDGHEDDHEPVAVGGLRLMVTIDGAGRPYGDNTGKFATLIGKLLRTHIPVKYVDWRLVPQFFKDEIWNGLMIKFTFGMPSCLVRPKVEHTYSQKFRTYKYTLKEAERKSY
ncbi:hypothetical protein MKX03_000586 [Papaver bracteatum]|nr:hypothetical protein MKX03_000586 [Papaver bracteatum]